MSRPVTSLPGVPGGLSVSGLYKSFGTRPVLTGVDLSVAPGSFTAILGSSGSGKTTLLRLLVGFERPDSGQITLHRRIVDDEAIHLPSQRRRIGYVPQEGGLFPHLSVEANIRFGLPRSHRHSSITHLIELAGLNDLTSRYPHQLSGGQQQRVALARALAIGPELVLLDEPFSSLDASLRAAVRDDVRKILAAAGTTAVLVTHDQDEALSLADAVAVLRDGRIVQQATPSEIYACPRDPDLAGFVGDSNLFDSLVADGQVRTCFGKLALLPEAAASLSAGQCAVVLLRPEQLTIAASSQDYGIQTQIIRTQFHGHDTVLTVKPLSSTSPTGTHAVTTTAGCIRARLSGRNTLPVGALLTLTARGPVMAWPVKQPT
jgi:iron(III) transport system ATP-binding protein